jgi:hypothetical protein
LAVHPQGVQHLFPLVGPLQLLELRVEEAPPVLHALSRAGPDVPRRLHHAGVGDAAPAAQLLWRVLVEEQGGVRDEALEVQGLRELGEDGVEHLGLRVRGVEELVAAVQDDLGEHVDAEDLLAGQQGVEEPRDGAVGLDVVRVHGQCAREGEEGLRARQVQAQRRVDGGEDVGDQAELCDGRRQVREHEVADAKGGEARYRGGAERGWQHEEEHLADVVVALEVAQIRVAAQGLGDEVRELGLLRFELGLRLVCMLSCTVSFRGTRVRWRSGDKDSIRVQMMNLGGAA